MLPEFIKSKSFLFLLLLSLLCLGLMSWISITGRYCPHCIDSAWTTSLDYFYIKLGYLDDRLFGGQIGTHKFISILQAHLRNFFAYFIGGFGALEMKVLSTFWVILAALIWFFALVKYFSLSIKLALPIPLFMIIFDAFFKVSQLARQESILLFFISVITLLSLKRWYILAGITVGMAFETHYTGGALGFVYLLTVFIYYKDYKWKCLSVLVGGFLGLVYYMVLHYPYLNEIPTILSLGSDFGINIIYAYYFDARYFRHIPELFLLLGCLYYCYKKSLFSIEVIRFSSIGLLLLSITFSIITRASEAYFVLGYPLIIIFIVSVVQQTKHSKKWLMLIIFYHILQYSTLLFINKNYNESEYFDNILKRVSVNEKIYIGHHNLFFVFNDTLINAKRFYGLKADIDLRGKTFVWIRDSKFEKINSKPIKKFINFTKKCEMELIDQYNSNISTVRFEKYNCTKVIN